MKCPELHGSSKSNFEVLIVLRDLSEINSGEGG